MFVPIGGAVDDISLAVVARNHRAVEGRVSFALGLVSAPPWEGGRLVRVDAEITEGTESVSVWLARFFCGAFLGIRKLGAEQVVV